MICHPIDAPFIDAIFNSQKDFNAIYALWLACKQEYTSGKLTQEILPKYEKRLAAL